MTRVPRDFEKLKTEMRFLSITDLERSLDGSDEKFFEYFFVLYHCSPSDQAGINHLRDQLRERYPKKVIAIGRHFVLMGEAAVLALCAYFQALAVDTTSAEDFRSYASERLLAIKLKHDRSQALPYPIDLTEGQLYRDEQLEFLACVAISNGQISQR